MIGLMDGTLDPRDLVEMTLEIVPWLLCGVFKGRLSRRRFPRIDFFCERRPPTWTRVWSFERDGKTFEVWAGRTYLCIGLTSDTNA